MTYRGLEVSTFKPFLSISLHALTTDEHYTQYTVERITYRHMLHEHTTLGFFDLFFERFPLLAAR